MSRPTSKARVEPVGKMTVLFFLDRTLPPPPSEEWGLLSRLDRLLAAAGSRKMASAPAAGAGRRRKMTTRRRREGGRRADVGRNLGSHFDFVIPPLCLKLSRHKDQRTLRWDFLFKYFPVSSSVMNN